MRARIGDRIAARGGLVANDDLEIRAVVATVKVCTRRGEGRRRRAFGGGQRKS